MNIALQSFPEDPFALEAPAAYRRWREAKLARHPRRPEELVVEVRDPRSLTDAEAGELRRICARSNMAVYASPLGALEDKAIALRLGAQLGLGAPLANLLADEDAITSLEAAPEKAGRGYIPYSSRRLLWHTDGYYNPPAQRIRAFILHCVRPAASGGENRLLDHEIAYLLLRDADPRYVEALSAPDAMTIPAREDVFTNAGSGVVEVLWTITVRTVSPPGDIPVGGLNVTLTSASDPLEMLVVGYVLGCSGNGRSGR